VLAEAHKGSADRAEELERRNKELVRGPHPEFPRRSPRNLLVAAFRILYEKLFNLKNFWQRILLQEFFDITNKDDAA